MKDADCLSIVQRENKIDIYNEIINEIIPKTKHQERSTTQARGSRGDRRRTKLLI